MRGAKVKGYLKDLNTGEIKKFQYNPSSFQKGASATYYDTTAPLSPYPTTSYSYGNAKVVPVELLVEGRNGEVDTFETFIANTLPSEKSSFAQIPHELLFAFSNTVYVCVLESYSLNCVEYDNSLIATVGIFSLNLKVLR